MIISKLFLDSNENDFSKHQLNIHEGVEVRGGGGVTPGVRLPRGGIFRPEAWNTAEARAARIEARCCAKLRLLRTLAAFGAGPTQRHIAGGDLKAVRQRHLGDGEGGRQINIGHFAAGFAEEMAVLAHVRTESGWAAVERHLPDQAALNQDAQAIINRGERDFRHARLRAMKNFFGGGVVMALGHDFKDVLPLAGKTKAARRELLLEAGVPNGFPFDFRSGFDEKEDTNKKSSVNGTSPGIRASNGSSNSKSAHEC